MTILETYLNPILKVKKSFFQTAPEYYSLRDVPKKSSLGSEKISNESAQTQIDTRNNDNNNDQLHNVSYQQLLDFYRQRELELEKLEELISNNRQDHQRSLRAEQHKISMLENEVTDFKNEIDHKTNQINYKDACFLRFRILSAYGDFCTINKILLVSFCSCYATFYNTIYFPIFGN